jgi:hypothetical protein
MGDQITIHLVQPDGERGRYSFTMGGELLENKKIDVSIMWVPEYGTLMLAAPFVLEGYTPDKRALFLEMINEINSNSDHVCTTLLMAGEHDMRGITRVSFILHRDYVQEETWQFTRDLVRANTLALIREMLTACIMIGGPSGAEGNA